MADLSKIKSNVAKMVQQGAPEGDIDNYIKLEGSNVDDVRSYRLSSEEKPTSIGKQLLQSFKQFPVSAARGMVEPIIKNIIARPMMGIESMISKQPPVAFNYPFPGFLGGDIHTEPIKTIPQAIGAAAQTASLALPGGFARSGAMYAGGGALEEQKKPSQVIADTALGAVLGKVAGVTMAGEPLLAGKTGQIVKGVIENTGKLPESLTRSIRRYKTLREGSQFKGIRQDLTPLERVENLKSKAKAGYGTALSQEEESLANQLKGIVTKEKSALEKSKLAIDESKSSLKQDIDNLSGKMKEETTHLRDNIDIASQKSAVEGKRRFSQFTNENSSSYANKLDTVINIAEQEGKLPTKQILQDIFDKTDAEIASTFIDTGAPLTKYNALKDKYISGFTGEANPEAQALSRAMGFKKGQMKKAGIDWSKVDVAQSGFRPPDVNAPINLKELLQDIRSVRKAISAKGQGVERAFTDEDLVSIIFQKNVGEYMSSAYPEFAKLQKAYAPIIEQMKAGRKIFKPGAPYDLGTAPNVLIKPDIVEKKLIGELERGTPGFSKGLGEISQPVKKAQQKLTGVERKYEIAKSRIEKLNANEQRDLSELLNMRAEVYKMAKEKVTVKSMVRQKQITDALNKRMATLETGKFRGKETISKLTARNKITAREKRIATAGGIGTMLDYLIRKIVSRAVLP